MNRYEMSAGTRTRLRQRLRAIRREPSQTQQDLALTRLLEDLKDTTPRRRARRHTYAPGEHRQRRIDREFLS